MKTVILAGFMVATASASFAQQTNEEFCAAVKESGNGIGMPTKLCVCMQDQMDAHLEDDVKAALNRVMLSGGTEIETFTRLSERPNFEGDMEAYGAAVGAKCAVN
ncbi:hypothetical protein GCM10007939_01920 [Amylibacter marinus]|uniref:HdeA/HdeB family protein n=1 Tax=Amylibacter marinus TaxID=1475483 RepID=A0ABQ5VRE4_9RHOB|nr:hypothetical protein [Amylibacter marinus]GLQ33909.1 hypothetical protein GCM10007939_01920 [Amylibacter marinus]